MPRQFAHVSSSVNVDWGCKENCVAVIALHKWGKSDSQIFRLLKPLKILQNFVYQAFKSYKYLWGVADRAWSGCLRCVRTKATIKTVWEWIHWNPLQKQKSSSRELNTLLQSMSCLIMDDLHMTAYWRSKGHLLTPCFEGDPSDKNRVSPPVARQERAWKHPLHRQENLHQWVVQLPEWQELCSNIPWGEGEGSKGAERSSPFLHHCLVGGVLSGGDTSSFLQERCENWCPSVSRECATRSCKTS